MLEIVHVRAREVLDSRGNPTVEAEVHCRGGHSGRAICPSGTSTGQAEAHELRDGDDGRFGGQGVQRAVANVRDFLQPALAGMNVADQAAVDRRLIETDATPDKSRMGANAILAVSLAVSHAAAKAQGIPLYEHIHQLALAREACQTCSEDSIFGARPALPNITVNMISGGLHAGGNLDFQDFLFVPLGVSAYSERLEWAVQVHRRLGKLLADSGFEGRLVADEGGYGPRLQSNRQAVEFIIAAIEKEGIRPGEEAAIALDVAASHFQRHNEYHLAATGGARLGSSEVVDHLENLSRDYPIVSIEDGLAEEDWIGWRELTDRLGERIQLVGDDLFATNIERLRRGIHNKVANSILVKMNQIGTLTETIDVCVAARLAGYKLVVSARSGETEDTTMADLAVGVRAEQIKIGSVTRGERLVKYNRLLRIAERLERGHS